jgi:cytidylate kinase
MIITISGTSGAGKSTVAKFLAEKLGYKHYSTGDVLRKLAVERGITINELMIAAKTDESIDRDIDSYSKKLGESEDNFVIDSRLAWHFIPHSVKIFLVADLTIRAERIFMQRRKEEKFETLEEATKLMEEREKVNLGRYRKAYGITYLDKKNYDLVVDTTKTTAEEVAGKILGYLKKKNLS